MLIPLKIGKKKYKLKPIQQLTTREFIEISKLELMVSRDTGLLTPDSIIKYIACLLQLPEDKAFFVSTSKVIEIAIGPVPDITRMPLPKHYDYKKLIDTVGQRHQVEGSGLEGFGLILFCLAVSQARSNNIDEVEKLRQGYLELPFAETLPAGFFFFKNYRAGSKKGLRRSKMRRFLTRIGRSKNRQARKG
jgi:hypothetical protein